MQIENKMMTPDLWNQQDRKSALDSLTLYTKEAFTKSRKLDTNRVQQIKASGLAISTSDSGADKGVAQLLLDEIVQRAENESDLSLVLDVFNETDEPEQEQLIRLTDKQLEQVDEQDFTNIDDYVHTDNASYYKAKNHYIPLTAHEVITNEVWKDAERVVKDLSGSIKRQIRQKSFNALLHGDGVDPRKSLNGLVNGRVSDTESVKDDASRNPEFIQRFGFNWSGAASDVERADAFNDFLMSLPTEYLRSSQLVMSRDSFKALTKLKDGNGQKLLKVTQGLSPSINDFPVMFDDTLALIGTSGYSVLVGDIDSCVDVRQYKIMMLINPYKTDGAVEFTFRCRQYSNIKDNNAVRAFYQA